MPLSHEHTLSAIAGWLVIGILALTLAIHDNTKPPIWLTIVCVLGGPVSVFIIILARALSGEKDG